jgi:hypothetical protein
MKCGNIRNYIERWFETLKDRLRNFDVYFPAKKSGIINIYRYKEENFPPVVNCLLLLFIITIELKGTLV